MSIQARPATKFNDLMGKAIDFLNSGRASELELKRLENEATALANADHAGSLEVRAHVAAVRGKMDDCHNLFRAALRATDDYNGTIVRYLIVLSLSDHLDELKQAYLELGGALRGDVEAMGVVAEMLAGSGFMLSAWSLTEELQRMGVDKRSQGTKWSDELVHFDEGSLTDSDLSAPVQFARKFLRSHGARVNTIQVSVVPFEEGSSAVLFEIAVDQTPSRTAELEWDLFGELEGHDFRADEQRKVMLALSGTHVA
ncbi:hypothetical protein [Stenotrophomonas sp.]|uniref:hypothetical protein n=1 Tax=Stenotrophomonas TaxID=40323 RepID=UPI00199D75F2|nr:hypothetical protein [Stenotrophomonas sp.]MBD3826158.1 hypothetical protein [Stenotrophomonas sp.]